MKRNLVITFAALAATAALFSCQKEAEIIEKSEPATEKASAIMTVIPGSIQTKTFLEANGANYDVKWSTGDQIAAFEVGNGVVASEKTPSTALTADAASAAFTMDFSGNASLEPNYSYVFVYPASSLKKYEKSGDPTIYEAQIPYQQTFESTTFDKNADVLISEGVTGEASRPTSVNVAFERIGATALMNIKAPSTSETISKIVFSTTEGNLAGYIQLDPAAGTHENTIMASGAKQIIELTPKTSTTYTGTIPVWFRLGAITLTDNFTVEVTTNENTYYKRVDLASASKTLAFENSGLTKFNVNMETAPKAVKFSTGTEITSIFPSTKKGIKVKYAKGTGTEVSYSSPFKFNKNNTITISGGDATIQQVAFDLKASSLGTLGADSGTYADGVWTAANNTTHTVIFSNSGNQAQFYSITVVYSGTGSETIEVATPSISFTAPTTTVEAGNTITTTLTTNSPGAKTYGTSALAVATVNSSGVITGVEAGEARITAYVAAYVTDYTSVAAVSAYKDIEVTAASGNVTVTWTASSGALGSTIAAVNGTATGTIATQATGGTPSYNWSYTRTLMSGTDNVGWSSNYIQLGKNGGVENVEFNTSNIPGTIVSVAVDCSSYSAKHKCTITVGGNPYLATTNTASWTTKSTLTGEYPGSGANSGAINISFTNDDSARALYIKSITVVYTPEP